MKRRQFLKGALGAGAYAYTSFVRNASAAQKRDRAPNIILFLVDDLGWRDLSCYGSRFYDTPHIDQMVSEGMRFTQAYSASCVCSPTRASILTGKHPARLHLTHAIGIQSPTDRKLLMPKWTQAFGKEKVTLAEVLRENGYTTGSVGKWHLGGIYPEQQGFDMASGYFSKKRPEGIPEDAGTSTHFYPHRIGNAYAKLPAGKPGDYLADRHTDEALDFISANKDKPFFLYLPHFAVHWPIEGKEEYVEKYKGRVRDDDPQNDPVYAAMIQSADDSMGRIRKGISELDMARDTILIFASDNGGWTHVTSNAPLRNGKATAYEGGNRVPMAVVWPGVVEPGTVCDTPTVSTDFFLTIQDMAGLDPIPGPDSDGLSILPLLTQNGSIERDTLYWHFPHYHPTTTPYGAIRKGDWKLIEYFEDNRLELYDLASDLGETQNRAADMPDLAEELLSDMRQWRGRVGAQMPTPNPAFSHKETESR